MFERIRKSTYQSQIVLLISFLALIRVFIAIVVDFTRPAIRPAELVVDFCIFAVFAMVTVNTYRKPSIGNINPVFSLLLTALLAINLIQFGAVQGGSKYNYLSGLFVIVMLYRGRQLIALVLVHLLVLAGVVATMYYSPSFFEFLFIHRENHLSDFWFTVSAISFFTYYLKVITTKAHRQTQTLTASLDQKVEEARQLNQQLEDQAAKLTEVRRMLEIEVTLRTRILEQKNKAIEEYMDIHSDQLHGPIRSLVKSSEKISGNSPLHSMLNSAVDELTTVVASISEGLKDLKMKNQS